MHAIRILVTGGHVRQGVRRAHRPALFQGHARPGDAAPRPLPRRGGHRDGDDDRQPRARRSRPRRHRPALPRRVREPASSITHGTDTMVETARALADAGLAGKTIVLTGAMVPYAFGSSDGLFNLGSALSFVQVLPPGRLRRHERPALRVGRGAQEHDDRRLRGTRLRAPDGAAAMSPTAALRSRLPSVGTTIFTVMSKLAADVGADQPVAGISRLRLRSGARRRRRAAHARRAQSVRADAGRARAAPGHRREVRALPRRRYDPDTEVTVTSGGTEAIFDAVASVVHPGDEVIVLEPCYDSYVPSIELNGGVPVVGAAAPAGLPHRLGRGARRRSRRARGC